MSDAIPMLTACGRNQRSQFTGPACACGSEATDLWRGEPTCQDCLEQRLARLLARRDT